MYWEKKYAQKNQSLYDREELFNSLCSNINDVFIIFHLEKCIYEYISPNIERVLGYDSKTFIENPLAFFDFTDKSCKEELVSLFKTNIQTTYFEKECELRNKSTGQLNWISFRFYPVMKNLKVIRYICCISDLTKTKQSQQILKNAFINSQKANEAKKEFLSHMSHELRTPINAIMGMAQIASNSPEDIEKVTNCLNKITISSKNLLDIINNILDMAKIDSNKLMLTYEAFNLVDCLNTFSSIIRTQTDLNGQKFELILNNIHSIDLIGDRLRLEQILNNCVSNAVKFTPTGGELLLEVSEMESHANKVLYRFRIIDNGIGMSEDFINRIYIPFEQEDSSITRKYGGSGLGMSITKDLVTLMGGNIKVTSSQGVGTTIIIDLVFTISNNITNETKVCKDKKTDYDFTGSRVLVVEDNEINLEITCEQLKNVNARVETALNGYEAIHKFTTSPKGYYDLILTDVQMPELNGYETAKAIRSSEHPDAGIITIIAMSADAYADDVTLNADGYMNYHMIKPIDIKCFYSLLKRVLPKEA
jgi:PAS domain S-box-containing protein